MNFTSTKENFQSKSTKLSQTTKKLTLNSPAELPKNSLSHVSKINSEIESVELCERTWVSHLKDCKSLIDQIRNRFDSSNDELDKNLTDSLRQVSDLFDNQVKNQTAENQKMQQKIDRLKQEKNELQKLVVDYSKRCTFLEEELGRY